MSIFTTIIVAVVFISALEKSEVGSCRGRKIISTLLLAFFLSVDILQV
ncbi:MAG: hypothetical protein V5A57_02675 [Candidatus Paceibacterota bacterium]